MKRTTVNKLIDHLNLCECLEPILAFEYAQGNQIVSYDLESNWPKKGSHLTILNNNYI